MIGGVDGRRTRSRSSARTCSSSIPPRQQAEALEQAPLYNNPPVESDEFVTFEEVLKNWQELKAGAQA